VNKSDLALRMSVARIPLHLAALWTEAIATLATQPDRKTMVRNDTGLALLIRPETIDGVDVFVIEFPGVQTDRYREGFEKAREMAAKYIEEDAGGDFAHAIRSMEMPDE